MAGCVRRKSTLTAEQYSGLIAAHSIRSLSTSSFAGTNYIGFASWLEQNAHICLSNEPQPSALAILYDFEQGPAATKYFTQDQLDDFLNNSPPEKSHAQVLFLRGFLSPAWISTVGSLYNVDPEFFLRHMDFLAPSTHSHLYSLPSLLSTTNNIMRLCIPTILHRENTSSLYDNAGQSYQDRSQQAVELAAYKRHLRMHAKCGDSLVREYFTLNSRISVVEQHISLCVTNSGLVIVWTDQARDLAKSPNGPWISSCRERPSCFPVIQHHPKMTIRNFKSSVSLGTSDTTHPEDPSAFPTEPTLPQSGSMLPLEYDRLLAFVFDRTQRSQHDPLSDLIPLFAHAAFAEVQFLNLIEHQTLTGIDDLKGEPDDTALANLQYLAGVLDRHAKQLKGTIRAINNLTEISKVIKESNTGKGSLEQKDGPQKSPNNDRIFIKSRTNSWTSLFGAVKGTFTVIGLLEDYEDLLARALKLSQQCTAGITVTMNRAMIQESRKAIEQSERVKRLTMLATLFIPLTFSSSLFSMDLEIFEQKARKFWWYIVVCVPITLLAYVWFIWDFVTIKRIRSRFSRRKKALGPGSIPLENI